jgi:hypothetical protein
MYTYGQVERALAQLHGIPPERAAGKLRSRLKHFSRIGLTPSRPGKGQKLLYTSMDCARWAICLEFAQLETPPERVKQILAIYGSSILKSFAGPMPGEDLIFWGEANFFAEAVTGKRESFFDFMEPSQAPGILKGTKVGRPINRLFMVNLTHLKRELAKNPGIDWEIPRRLLGRVDWDR